MEDDVGVRKLVELIFDKKLRIDTRDSSIPTCLLMDGFYPRLRYVLFMRQLIVSYRWEKSLLTESFRKWFTPDVYVAYVLHKGFNEYFHHQNVFDGLISVCCLVGYFNNEMPEITNVNVCKLNSDIIMGFYEYFLKETFRKCGGIQRMVEYILHHEHLEWKWNRNDLESPDGPSTPANAETIEKLQNECSREIHYKNSTQPDTVHNTCGLNFAFSQKPGTFIYCYFLAQEILKTTSVKLPTSPNRDQSVRKGVPKLRNLEKYVREKRFEIVAELQELWPVCLSSKYDSKTTQVAEENEDIQEIESLFQAVLRDDHPNISGLVTSDHTPQKKAGGVLEYLQDTIESVTEVLDEYNKE